MIHTRLNGGKGFHVADHLGLTSQSWASLGIFPRVFCHGKNWKNTIIGSCKIDLKGNKKTYGTSRSQKDS